MLDYLKNCAYKELRSTLTKVNNNICFQITEDLISIVYDGQERYNLHTNSNFGSIE